MKRNGGLEESAVDKNSKIGYKGQKHAGPITKLLGTKEELSTIQLLCLVVHNFLELI